MVGFRLKALAAAACIAAFPLVSSGDDTSQAIKALKLFRSRLAGQLSGRLSQARPADGQYQLWLNGAAEGFDVLARLHRVDGQWKPCRAVVPWWQQETQKEKFSYLYRDGGLGIEREKFDFTVTPDKLEVNDGRLRGKAQIEYILDLPATLRMPPGGRHLYTTDGRWSLLDQWYVGPRVTRRRQQYQFDARIDDDRRWLDLELTGGIDGRPVKLTGTIPPGPSPDLTVTAPTWNAGMHQVDASGLEYREGRLIGELRVRFNPDAWFPKKVWYAKYKLDVPVTDGRAEGTFSASVAEGDFAKVVGQNKTGTRPGRDGPADFQGKVAGVVLPAVIGRYRSSGPLGERQGAIRGGKLPFCSDVEKFLGEPEGTPAQQARELYSQVRALRMALDWPGLPLADALRATRRPAPKFANADDQAEYVYRLAELAKSALGFKGGSHFDVGVGRGGSYAVGRGGFDEHFGPYYGGRNVLPLREGQPALPEQIPDKGAQAWHAVGGWKILGPMRQPKLLTAPTPAMPEILPALQAVRPIDANALGRDYKGDRFLAWESVKIEQDGTLRPPAWTWSKRSRNKTPGRPNSSWYAAAELVSPSRRSVFLAVDVHDHGTLWINDQLVWRDQDRQVSYSRPRTAVFQVELMKGVNRLLLRVLDDRGGSWAKMHVCTAGTSARGMVKSETVSQALDRRKPKVNSGETPPLAWDLVKGTNVAWSVDVDGAKSTPTVAGDKLLVAAAPHDLVCLDARTGEQLWRSSASVLETIDKEAAKAFESAGEKQRQELIEKHLGKRYARGSVSLSTPLWDGKRAYLHVGTGVLACFDADGKRLWMVRTHMTDASLTSAMGKVIVEGAATEEWAKAHELDVEGLTGRRVVRAGHNYGKSENHTRRRLEAIRSGAHHGIMAIDAKGKTSWASPGRGSYAGEPMMIDIPAGEDKVEAVLVTRGAQVLDPGTGQVLRDYLDLGMWDWLSATASEGRILSAWEGGRASAKLWLTPAGVGCQVDWRATRLHAYVAGGPNDGWTDGNLYYVWRRVPEHAKHCPAYALMLDVFDARSGRRIDWIKPAIRGTNRAVRPVGLGGYLYLPDQRGGPHSGGTPDQREVVVTTTGPDPVLIARNPTPNFSGGPVRVGRRLVMRCGGKIVCVGTDGEAAQAYEVKTAARHVFERIYDAPADRKMTSVKPLEKQLGDATPIVTLKPGESMGDWLVAGPLPADADKPNPGDSVPVLGGELTIGGKTAKLQAFPRALITRKTSFHNDGRLDDWQVRRTVELLDLAQLADRGEGVYYLGCVVDNPRRRLAYWAADARGLSAYLAGREIAPGAPLDLPAGRYPLWVRVEPGRFQRRQPTPPIDVAAAVKAGDLKEVDWPSTWTVFGPIPEASGAPDANDLRSIGKTLTLGETRFGAIPLPTIGRSLDLTAIVDLPEGQTPKVGEQVQSKAVGQQQHAWAMAEIDCPAGGHLVVNAAADWFMEWYVDGKRVYGTLSTGNGRAPTQLSAHTFSVAVGKGKHVVAVRVKPGSKGWSVTSLGGLAVGDPEALAGKHPAMGGVQAKAAEWRVSLSMREVAHPADVQAVRQRQIRRAAEVLRWIVRELPDSDEASKAERLLEALPKQR